MELRHEFTLPGSPVEAWSFLTDPVRVGGCLPGATVARTGKRNFSGSLALRVSPLAVTYTGAGRFVKHDARRHTAVIRLDGEAGPGDSSASATVTMRLLPDGPSTLVLVSTRIEVTGAPARFSPRIWQEVANQLVAPFVVCAGTQLAPTVTPDPTPQQGAARTTSLRALARAGGYLAAGAAGLLVGRRMGRPVSRT